MSDSPLLFDRSVLALRRGRALRKGASGADFLIATVAADLAERVAAVTRNFQTATALGGITGHLAEAIQALQKTDFLLRADAAAIGDLKRTAGAIVDEEYLPLAAQSFDLVASALSLQFVNDLPGALLQIRQALKPDGLFLAAFVGGDSLSELRASLAEAESEILGGVSPRVIPTVTVQDIGALLQRAGFALPVVDRDPLIVRYDSLFDLMADLRAMGATNMLRARMKTPTPRRLFLKAAEIYARRYSDPDGRIRATFEIISVSGWAPHDSQQQPLKPSSAKMHLADALRATDVSGEE